MKGIFLSSYSRIMHLPHDCMVFGPHFFGIVDLHKLVLSSASGMFAGGICREGSAVVAMPWLVDAISTSGCWKSCTFTV